MQNKSEILADEVIDGLIQYFQDRVEDFVTSDVTDTPYKMFKIEFTIYNFYYILFNYDRGRFGCSINYGKKLIGLNSSQKWFDKADMKIFYKEIDEQIRLRIPDKYLIANGWN